MTEVPENVDLGWIARHVVELREEVRQLRQDVRTLRSDMDMLVRLCMRMDATLNELWLSQSDLRKRIEALEGR